MLRMWYNIIDEQRQNQRSKIMIKLAEKDRPKGIWVGDMKDGDIGVIVAWMYNMYIGHVVQRYQNSLIAIGMTSDSAWHRMWLSDECALSSGCRVRLLEKGEMLVVA